MKWGEIGPWRRLRYWWRTGRKAHLGFPRSWWEFHFITGALRTDDLRLMELHRQTHR